MSIKRANQDIREAMTEAGLKHWQVAEQIGMSSNYFTVVLRTEIAEERREKIFKAIEELKEKLIEELREELKEKLKNNSL